MSRRCAAPRRATQPIEFRQTNSETQLIDWVHEAIDKGGGIIINPAAYTFTSLAMFDALKMFPGPIIELHISNIHKRESMYHNSYVSKVATAIIAGLGAKGYVGRGARDARADGRAAALASRGLTSPGWTARAILLRLCIRNSTARDNRLSVLSLPLHSRPVEGSYSRRAGARPPRAASRSSASPATSS